MLLDPPESMFHSEGWIRSMALAHSLNTVYRRTDPRVHGGNLHSMNAQARYEPSESLGRVHTDY